MRMCLSAPSMDISCSEYHKTFYHLVRLCYSSKCSTPASKSICICSTAASRLVHAVALDLLPIRLVWGTRHHYKISVDVYVTIEEVLEKWMRTSHDMVTYLFQTDSKDFMSKSCCREAIADLWVTNYLLKTMSNIKRSWLDVIDKCHFTLDLERSSR